MAGRTFTKELSPPLSIRERIVAESDRIKEIIQLQNLNLTTEKKERIQREVKQKYNIWKRKTKGQKSELIELNELMEGITEETNFPFEESSNLSIGYATGLFRTFRATFNDTAYRDPDIFKPISYDNSIDMLELDKVEKSHNYYFHTKTNGLDTLKTGTLPCFRDGVLVIAGYWKRDIQKAYDVKIFKTAEEFVLEYPSAIEAGISQEEYDKVLDKWVINKDAIFYATFQYDYVAYDNPYYEIVPLAKFVYFPLYEKSIKDMEMYGWEYTKSFAYIKEKTHRGEFYRDFEKKRGEFTGEGLGGRYYHDSWDATKDYIEGVSAYSAEEYKTKDEKGKFGDSGVPVKLVDLVVKLDLDNDGIQEKYFITYCPEYRTLMSVQRYLSRKNIDCCVGFRLIRREDRFRGSSLLKDARDKFELLDDIHRHRNNIRMLVGAPVMLANKREKENIDPWGAENIIRPGTTFWVDDPQNAVRQLEMHNFDVPGNERDEEELIIRYLEFVIGPTQAMSGRETQTDPRAPMGKTIALLQQANLRIDDYLDEFRSSLPDLARLHHALLAMHSPEKIKYTVEIDGRVKGDEIDRTLLDNLDIDWMAKRRSVTISPEFAMQRLGGLLQVYAQLLPLIQKRDKIAITIWNRMVVASGETNKEELIIPMQEEGQEQQIQKLQELLGGMGEPSGVEGGVAGMPPLNQEIMSPSEKSPLGSLGGLGGGG